MTNEIDYHDPNDFSLMHALKTTYLSFEFKKLVPSLLLWTIFLSIVSLLSPYVTQFVVLGVNASLSVAVSRYFLKQEQLSFYLYRFQQHEIRYLLYYIGLTLMAAFFIAPLILIYMGQSSVLLNMLGFLSFALLIWVTPTGFHFLTLISCTNDYKKAFYIAKKTTFPINLSLIGGFLFIFISIFLIGIPFIVFFTRIHPFLANFIGIFMELLQTTACVTLTCIVFNMRITKENKIFD